MVLYMDEHKDLYQNNNNHEPGKPTVTKGQILFLTKLFKTLVNSSGYAIDPSNVPSHVTGLANQNVQSASFKMLQKALEMDLDLTSLHGTAKAPRQVEGIDEKKNYKYSLK
jgi:hypothetical protein